METQYKPALGSLVFISSASSQDSDEYAQPHQSLPCSHTQRVDEKSDKTSDH